VTPRTATKGADPFRALADPTRRSILELLDHRAVASAGEIAERFPGISRPAVSRHLRVLREADLVTAEGVGREQQYRLNRAVLARVHRDWFARFTPIRDASLSALKKQVESAAPVARTQPRGAKSGTER
jgi:DNA-binding transcriptional ArsR family regulator